MNIEPRLVPSPAIKGQPDSQAAPSPEIEQLLAELKVRVGDKIAAVVNKVTPIAADEQQLLLQSKIVAAPAAQRQGWQALLSLPEAKLVTLTHKQVEFTAITHLPITKGQQLAVVVSARGLQLLIDGALGQQQGAPRAGQLAPAHFDPAQPTVLARGASYPGVGGLTAGASGSSARSGPQAPTDQSLSRDAGSIRAIAAAVASALPKAQPTSVLLGSNAKLMALLQHVPSHALPPPIKPLLTLLHTLEQQTLQLNSNTPLAPATIAKAFSNNGVFHEHNALRAVSSTDENKTLNENDIKSLLIKTVDGLSQLGPTPDSAGAKQALTNDAVARLWLGLVNGLGRKAETLKMDVSAKENLLLLSQNLAQNSLAKIQLNQYRSLAATTSEAGPPNQAIHLDIPIKWPDTYGNAYLQIFPPKVEEEHTSTADKSKRQKQRRWRIFMELEMGDDGDLAVELTVADKNIDVTFWAEKDDLRQKAAAHLQHLRSELAEQGLLVNELRCSRQPPPEQKMNLNYSLIDVKT